MKLISPSNPILWLAGLGLLSGLLSSYPPDIAETLKVFGVAIYPGVLFGVVIGAGLFYWGKSGWAGALVALLMIVASWVAATQSFRFITNDGEILLYVGALVAGAIGAAGTQLGGAYKVSALRRPILAIITVVVGAIAGFLVIFPLKYNQDAWFILFGPWQALVAASIGYALKAEQTDNCEAV